MYALSGNSVTTVYEHRRTSTIDRTSGQWMIDLRRPSKVRNIVTAMSGERRGGKVIETSTIICNTRLEIEDNTRLVQSFFLGKINKSLR